MKTLLIFLASFFLVSCATVFSGTKAKIKVSGTPDSSSVYVNGNYAGNAPLKVKVSKNGLKNSGTKVLVKNGDKQQEITLTRKVKVSAVIGNILFTGGIGLIIDFATGAIYKPYPDNIKYKL